MNHIMIDGYRGNENRLDDMRTVNSVLCDIVADLNLSSAMPPFLLPYYYAKESDDDGISAFTILEGGHITIHTFPRRGCVFVDLLYDGYFDEDKLKNLLRNAFSYETISERSCRTERRFLDTTIDSDKIWDGRQSNIAFGPHIIARVEDTEVCFEQIFDMLDRLPTRIGMIPICRPYVLKTEEFLSGIVLIAQSHIAFHYCIKEKTLFCDLFSCSDYKVSKFTEYLTEQFGTFEHMTLIRGSKYDRVKYGREQKIKRLGKWVDIKGTED